MDFFFFHLKIIHLFNKFEIILKMKNKGNNKKNKKKFFFCFFINSQIKQKEK